MAEELWDVEMREVILAAVDPSWWRELAMIRFAHDAVLASTTMTGPVATVELGPRHMAQIRIGGTDGRSAKRHREHLVKAGVLVLSGDPAGRRSSTYRLVCDWTRWGRVPWCVSRETLDLRIARLLHARLSARLDAVAAHPDARQTVGAVRGYGPLPARQDARQRGGGGDSCRADRRAGNSGAVLVDEEITTPRRSSSSPRNDQTPSVLVAMAAELIDQVNEKRAGRIGTRAEPIVCHGEPARRTNQLCNVDLALADDPDTFAWLVMKLGRETFVPGNQLATKIRDLIARRAADAARPAPEVTALDMGTPFVVPPAEPPEVRGARLEALRVARHAMKRTDIITTPQEGTE